MYIFFKAPEPRGAKSKYVSLPNLVWFKGRVLKPILMSLFFLWEKQREERWWVTHQRLVHESSGRAVAVVLIFHCGACINRRICQVSSRSLKAESSPSPCLWFSPSSILIKNFPLASLLVPSPLYCPLSSPKQKQHSLKISFLCPCCLIYWGPSLRPRRRRTAARGRLKQKRRVVIYCELTTKEFQLFVVVAYEARKSLLHTVQNLHIARTCKGCGECLLVDHGSHVTRWASSWASQNEDTKHRSSHLQADFSCVSRSQVCLFLLLSLAFSIGWMCEREGSERV